MDPLASAVGSLTIVDLNLDTPTFYWRGEKLNHVVACHAVSTQQQRRVALRVVRPDRVVPALPEAERARLNAVYALMQEQGVVINFARRD